MFGAQWSLPPYRGGRSPRHVSLCIMHVSSLSLYQVADTRPLLIHCDTWLIHTAFFEVVIRVSGPDTQLIRRRVSAMYHIRIRYVSSVYQVCISGLVSVLYQMCIGCVS